MSHVNRFDNSPSLIPQLSASCRPVLGGWLLLVHPGCPAEEEKKQMQILGLVMKLSLWVNLCVLTLLLLRVMAIPGIT